MSAAVACVGPKKNADLAQRRLGWSSKSLRSPWSFDFLPSSSSTSFLYKPLISNELCTVTISSSKPYSYGKASHQASRLVQLVRQLQRRVSLPQEKNLRPPRTVFINENLPDDYFDNKHRVKKEHVYSSNQVITSKYTIITFLPRNLLEQFRRVANVYVLYAAFTGIF